MSAPITRSARKKAFLAANPICCYCGCRPADTIDHSPARVCFVGKQGPEGYEFPACNKCNSNARVSEQVVAFYIHLISKNVDEAQKLYKSLTNNCPWLLPNFDPSIGQKAKFLLNRNIILPASQIQSMKLATIPDDANDHLSYFTAKLTRSMYYKYFRRHAPESFKIGTTWLTGLQPNAENVVHHFTISTQHLVETSRTNVDIGRQFNYRISYSEIENAIILIFDFNDKIYLLSVGMEDKIETPFSELIRKIGLRDASNKPKKIEPLKIIT